MPTTVASPATSMAATASLSGGSAPATATSSVNHQLANSHTVGATAGLVNKVYSAPFSVASGTPLSLDLTSLTDPLGNAINFAAVKSITITNDNTTAGQYITPFGGTNGLIATGTTLIHPGGGLHWDSGTQEITVDGTHKIVTLTAAAGTIAGKITIMGRQ